MAVCIRAEPRPTADVDVAVAVRDDDTATALVADLGSRGYRMQATIPQEDVCRIATVRLSLTVGDGDVTIDLFFASSGVEAEVVAGATPCEVAPGLVLPVASLAHLIAAKLCWRSSDKRTRDLRALIARADSADIDEVHRLAAVITERGYHRGRDLEAVLAGWLTEVAT